MALATSRTTAECSLISTGVADEPERLRAASRPPRVSRGHLEHGVQDHVRLFVLGHVPHAPSAFARATKSASLWPLWMMVLTAGSSAAICVVIARGLFPGMIASNRPHPGAGSYSGSS